LFKLQALQDSGTPLDAHHPPLTLNGFEGVHCPFKNLQMMPLAYDYKMHFIPQLLTGGDAYQEVEIFDLQNHKFLEKAHNNTSTNNKTNAFVRYLCPTMLTHLGMITIFGGNSKIIGLYSLDTSRKSWLLVDSSNFSFQEINFENCVCDKYASDNVVVVTVLEASVFFYLFSPLKKDNMNWKSAKLSLSEQTSDCQIQSCVVISDDLFCSLLTSTHLLVYQVDLGVLYRSTDGTCSLEPTKSWVLEKLNLERCFLSSLNEEVVTIMVKKADKNLVEFSELKHFNLGSLKPLTSFCTNVEVFSATVIPDTTNLAIVYSDSDKYKMSLLNGKSLKCFNLIFTHVCSYIP